ncbi:Mss4-like protein [Mycena filopes]|nr:Mss4-like protein [Mycena filopes]
MSAEPNTYSGNCHCGALKFTVVLPAPLDSTPLYACPCSICTKKGYLFLTPRKSAVTVTKGAGADGLGAGVLAEYVFGAGRAAHRFCGTCGTPFGVVNKDVDTDAGAGDGGVVALNARMLQGVDIWGLQVKEAPWYHAGEGPVYVPPVFPGLAELVAAPLEAGEKIYAGSCHCGAVTFGLRSPWALEDKGPADTPNNEVEECDCSSCIRHAGIYTYPRPAARVPMHVAPPSALTTYFSAQGKQFGGAQFCGLCGCQVFQKLVGPPKERVAALPPPVQARIAAQCDCRPVHLRALDVALGSTAEDKAEWERIRAGAKRERGSASGAAYVVPE